MWIGEFEFEERDHVFLKVTPRLRLKGPFKTCRLSLRYMGPYQVVSRVGEVEYQLALPSSLFRLYDVSTCRNFESTFLIFSILFFQIQSKWSQISHSNCIMVYISKSLRSKEIPWSFEINLVTFRKNSI